MTRAQPPGSGPRFSIGIAALAVALTAVIAIAIGASMLRPAATPGTSPTPGPTLATPSGATASVDPALASATNAPSGPVASIDCRPDPGPVPSYLSNDPCPSAIVAVELAVATVRLPIERMVIEAGPLYCNVIWEGLGSPPICYEPFSRAGQFRHAYVSFVGSTEVAVVMLGLDMPADDNDPFATRPPWKATLVTVAVPPAGWVMP